MMGVADFPLEIFKALSSRSSEDSKPGDSSSSSMSTSSSELNLAAKQSQKTSSQSQSSTPVTVGGGNSDQNTSSTANPNSNPTRNSDVQGAMSRQAPSSETAKGAVSISGPEVSDNNDVPSSKPISESSSRKEIAANRPPRTNSNDVPQISFDAALGAGKGVGRMVGAGLKSPMDFTLSLAKGFHNAPKLYGDESVRKSERITDFQSGIRAAGKVWTTKHILTFC